MKIYSFCIVFFFLFLSTGICAQEEQGNIIQSLEKYEPGQGRITIHQDERIAALIGSSSESSKKGNGTFKTSGYRVQVYAGGNSRESKAEAQRLAEKVKNYLPDIKVYAVFNPPRWVCRVGDFRNMEEADAVMRELRKTGIFKELSIVRDQVTISY